MPRLVACLLVLFSVHSALSSSTKHSDGPTVTLSRGTFQGFSANGIDQFLGIRFAQAEYVVPQSRATSWLILTLLSVSDGSGCLNSHHTKKVFSPPHHSGQGVHSKRQYFHQFLVFLPRLQPPLSTHPRIAYS